MKVEGIKCFAACPTNARRDQKSTKNPIGTTGPDTSSAGTGTSGAPRRPSEEKSGIGILAVEDSQERSGFGRFDLSSGKGPGLRTLCTRILETDHSEVQ